MGSGTRPPRGELRVPHWLVARIAQAELSAAAHRLLWRVLDETLGWNRFAVCRKVQFWARALKASEDTARRALKDLDAAGWISYAPGAGGRSEGTVVLGAQVTEAPPEAWLPPGHSARAAKKVATPGVAERATPGVANPPAPSLWTLEPLFKPSAESAGGGEAAAAARRRKQAEWQRLVETTKTKVYQRLYLERHCAPTDAEVAERVRAELAGYGSGQALDGGSSP